MGRRRGVFGGGSGSLGCSRRLTAVSAPLVALFAAKSAAATSPSGTPVQPAHSDGEKFNCGRNWWEAVTAFLGGDWPHDKKEWCCKHRKVGCESKSKSREVKYDCQEGYEVREEAWEEEKRTWCCDHERVGCKTDAWNAEPFDCRADLSDWATQWSDAKKAWCCEFEGQGCQLPSTSTTPENFDCLTDLLQWETRWSSARQAWCCQRHGRGCISTSAAAVVPAKQTEEYDCTVGYSNWEKSWSAVKQAWCCAGRARCVHQSTTPEPTTTPVLSTTSRPSTTSELSTTSAQSTSERTTTAETTTDELYDCRLEESESTEKWTGWKKEWCCDRHNVGCQSTTTVTTSPSKPYDCLEDVATWEESWPTDKKRWCCKHELRGCTDCDVACVVAGFPASCRNRIEWLEVHDLNKKANGCTRARHIVLEECPACGKCGVQDACPAVANLTQKYDCQAGRANADKGWSPAKKEWCCHYYDEGCPPTTTTTTTITTTPEPYDCTEGVADWRSGWPEKKRAYCCKHHSVGCTSCDSSCIIDGLSATCRDRVGWLLGHVMRNQEDACTHAHGLVLDQCPDCAACDALDACPADGAVTTTTSQPFDCQAGLNNWRLGWSEVKRAWCCRHSDLGCGESGRNHKAPGDKFDCQVGLSAWSYEKTDWCCTHRQLGCSLLVTTSAAPPAILQENEAAVQEEEEPYNCQGDVLTWARTWPKKKQDWCCWRYSLGCSPDESEDSASQSVVSSQWVARDTLPDAEGETLEGYSQSIGSLDDMKRWCEEHSDCVGFAMQPESLLWYPKKVGTGFDAGTATWTADKWRGKTWRWYYIQGRGATSLQEVSAKFEQPPPPAVLPATVTGMLRKSPTSSGKAVAFTFVGCLALAALLAVVHISGRPASRNCEDHAASYLSLLSVSPERSSGETSLPE